MKERNQPGGDRVKYFRGIGELLLGEHHGRWYHQLQ